MTTASAVLSLCPDDTEGAGEGSPFTRALDAPNDPAGDSSFQRMLRGGPRPGEDWDAHGLMDVLLGRARAAGFLAAHGVIAEADGRGDVQVVIVAQPGTGEGVMGDVHTTLTQDWATMVDVADDHDLSAPDSMEYPRPSRDRLDMLNLAITRLQAQTNLNRLGYAYDLTKFPLLRSVYDAMLQVWWQARQVEGHSAASARLLLGLSAHPTILTEITYDTAETPRLRARP